MNQSNYNRSRKLSHVLSEHCKITLNYTR